MNLYQKYRKDMKTGDILQWRTNSVVGMLIRYFSKAAVNHTSLIVDINRYDRKFQLEAIETGITLTAISNRISNFNGSIWWLPLKDEFYDNRRKLNKIAFKYVGVKYDYENLFAQLFGRVSAEGSKFFCSEYAYWCNKEAGIEMYNPSGKAPRPGDMHKLGIYRTAIKIL